MSKGKARVNYLGREGLVQHETQPDYGFLYEASLNKSPKWDVGDRVVLPDGRVFRYAKVSSASTGVAYHGAGGSSTAVVYATVKASQVVGDKQVTVEKAGITADLYRGGYVVIYGASDEAQTRYIIGNTASDSDDYIILYLDAPLTAVATSGATYCEVFTNPYAAITHTPDNYGSVIGLPAANAAASEYVWVQTWGPCVISGGEDLGSPGAEARALMFGANGALFYNATGTHERGQLAGFTLNVGSTCYGPLIMLQISP